MTDIAIRCEGLSKQYRIGERVRYKTFRDTLSSAASLPFRRLRSSLSHSGSSERSNLLAFKPSNEPFWALDDVSFEVKAGEVVGIIGRNGAGKSTLLKILSRITEPTRGRAEINGRVGSLLEVGTGFNPELTGRENIYLNGAILGMRKAEIERRFDEIVAFAEVERFVDTPVKYYSSGMYLRLAFAVAAHLDPELLMVDEVLAVGDGEFQKKCLGKMEYVASQEGRTILFVSHNMAAIEGLCGSAILLAGGSLVRKGETRQVVKEYLTRVHSADKSDLAERNDRQGSGAVRFTSVSLLGGTGEELAAFQCGSPATLSLKFENTENRDLRNLRIALGIDTSFGQRVLLLDSELLGQELNKVPSGAGTVNVSLSKLGLVPGRYHFTIFATINGVIADWIKGAASFDVEPGDYYGTGRLPPADQGIFLTDHTFTYAVGLKH
jgi:lipopolysaccharide transport system ATP-binding protein